MPLPRCVLLGCCIYGGVGVFKLVVITVAGGKRVVDCSMLFLISIDGMLRSRMGKGSVCGEFSRIALWRVGVP